MKLNKLASAVSVSLAALALTACGSSDDDKPIPNTPTVVDNTAAQDAAKQAAEQAKIAQIKQAAIAEGLNEEQAVKFANANKDKSFDFASDEFKNSVKLFKEQAEKDAANKPVDAGSNNVISEAIKDSNPLFAGFDASKLTSVQSGHYVRQETSNFDRAANPNSKNTANSGTVAHPSLNFQNPYLSNYLVGAEGEKTGDKTADVWAVNYVGEYVKEGEKITEDLSGTKADYKTIGLDAKGNEKEPVDSKADLDIKNRKTLQEANSSIINAKAVVFNAANSKIEATNENGLPSVDLDGATGLIAYAAPVSAMGKRGIEQRILGVSEDLKTGQAVRIFGKNYKDYSLNADVLDRKAAQDKTTYNSYQAGFDDKGNLEITETKLVNVQYGRLTTNIDRLNEDPRDPIKDADGKDARGPLKLIPRPFEAKGTEGSVDIYFYRGTNETDTTVMNKIKAEANEKLGGKIHYLGHALTYGVSPILTKKDTENTFLPNSFGTGDQVVQTIGNFVEATFDTANSTLKGNIYNFINDNAGGVDKNGKDTKFKRQDLIGFSGAVHGNTAIGTANYAGETGNFRGSFFGQDAEELGGNITSVSQGNGYGEGKWGAVFGAEKVTEEEAKTKTQGINFDLNTTGTGTNVDP